MELVRLLIESIVGFVALFVLTKFLGKSQITQITAFDFIAALVLGELVGNALFDPQAGVTMILFAVTIWGILIYITEMLTQKFRRTRSLLEGKPSIVIRRGQIQRDVMKENKLDMNQLMHLLRDKGVFSIQEVDYAIFETNGTVNVMKKYIYQNPTNEFFNATPQETVLPIAIISDGELQQENLKEIEWDKQHVFDELDQQGLKLDEVMYAEYNKNEKGLYVLPY
ncbi:DUF421 domain-containing protein [Tenuibacillus multivorans]|uniref:Uncharacterized membrane protein YcaP, DUF421 family n=1 Tax=Tenuibacillus multivorans TaxID=237069 RepID=A0A1H0EJG1_9BACI|nr:DUF421 domain-containing protein [Tenuibacillus multivorans]GEL77133.1 UPF0702 transmembrane protein YetF [Tenuibacillus multivorans]SDN82481.1 Uncharacterized membrane protein YcaP, DUF421 family [Tenuibacillus multivorans]